MIPAAIALVAAIAVTPTDRLALADRLFNRGAYADAAVEYAALKGEKAIAGDELLFREAECARALGRSEQARLAYGKLLADYPLSRHATRARLMRALSATGEVRRAELKVLDSDRVEPSVRAAALYHLGSDGNDAAMLERAVQLDPKGRYADYARLRRAGILAKAADPAARRKAVQLYLELAFGTDASFAEEAYYLAAATCYADRRYRDAAAIFHRFLKKYPNARRAAEARMACAWSDYLAGRYADAQSLLGDAKTDDALYLSAACAYADGDHARAATLFKKYLETYPNGRYRKDAILPLARLAFEAAEKSGDGQQALVAARRAAKISVAPADRLRLGWAQEKAGEADAAVETYHSIARDFPGTADAAEALYRKALCDLRAKRWAPAELALKEALAGKLDPRRRGEALYWRGIACVRLDHVAEGVDLLKEALKEGLTLDESREARLIVADADYNAGRIGPATEAYRRLVREGAAERMSAAKTLAVGKLLSGDEALLCAKALEANRDAAWRQAGFALAGRTEEAATNYAAAVTAYRSALAEKCETESLPEAALRLGALEVRAGAWDRAEATLKRAVDLNAGDAAARAEAYLHLAEACLGRKDAKNARAYATVVTTLFDMTPSAAVAAEILKRCGEEPPK